MHQITTYNNNLKKLVGRVKHMGESKTYVGKNLCVREGEILFVGREQYEGVYIIDHVFLKILRVKFCDRKFLTRC